MSRTMRCCWSKRSPMAGCFESKARSSAKPIRRKPPATSLVPGSSEVRADRPLGALKTSFDPPPSVYTRCMAAPRTPPPSPGEVTVLLQAWSEGDVAARDRLMPYVYAELRRRAAGQLRRERRGHTLRPTDLVH